MLNSFYSVTRKQGCTKWKWKCNRINWSNIEDWRFCNEDFDNARQIDNILDFGFLLLTSCVVIIRYIRHSGRYCLWKPAIRTTKTAENVQVVCCDNRYLKVSAFYRFSLLNAIYETSLRLGVQHSSKWHAVAIHSLTVRFFYDDKYAESF